LRCSTNSTSIGVYWGRKSVGSSLLVNIFDEGHLIPEFPTLPSPRFEIDSSSPGQYDLVVLKADSGHAGQYICADEIGRARAERVYVELVIVTSLVSCDIITEKSHSENDNKYGITGQPSDPHMLLHCGVNFVGNVRPSVKWIDAEGQLLISPVWQQMTTEVRKVGVVESADWWTAGMGVPAVDSVGSWFRCYVNFTRNKTTTNLTVETSNRDTTRLECTVQRDGLVATRNVWISSPGESNLEIQLGDMVTCLDDGRTFYPNASYSWLNLEDRVTRTIGSRLELTVAGTYRYACTASNGTHSRSRNVTITVRSTSQEQTSVVSAVDERNSKDLQGMSSAESGFLGHTLILTAVPLIVMMIISCALIAVLTCKCCRRREQYKPMRKLQLHASHSPTQSSAISTSTTTVPQTVESLTEVFPVVVTSEPGCYESLMRPSDNLQEPPPLYERLFSASH
jgi:hypothetical protein